MPEKRFLLSTFSTKIRWGDMDALGHVNNAAYFRYMETARVEWLSDIGISLGKDNQSFVLANTFCTFNLPITYPCEININSFATELTNTRLDIVHEFVNAKEKKQVFAVGLATCVWVNLARGKAVALPDSIKKLIKL